MSRKTFASKIGGVPDSYKQNALDLLTVAEELGIDVTINYNGRSGRNPSRGGPNMATKLNEAKRKKLIDGLIGNECCWEEEDREVLNSLSDTKLVALHKQAEQDKVTTAVANAARKGFTDPSGNTHTWNEETGKWESKGKEAVKNEEKKEEKKPMTDDEWLKAAPDRIRSAVQNAMEIEAREKATLIEQLTANIGDEDAQKRLAERLKTKPLDELRDLALLSPESETPRLPSYAGAAGPVGNREPDKLTDVLPMPVMNYDQKVG